MLCTEPEQQCFYGSSVAVSSWMMHSIQNTTGNTFWAQTLCFETGIAN
jgi:hypothetical protein